MWILHMYTEIAFSLQEIAFPLAKIAFLVKLKITFLFTSLSKNDINISLLLIFLCNVRFHGTCIFISAISMVKGRPGH